MKLTPLQKRAERKSRNQTMLDMNLVSLNDVFTILIFFPLSGASGVEVLTSHKALRLPQSVAETSPRDTVVMVVSGGGNIVDARRVAKLSDVLATQGDLIDGSRSRSRPRKPSPSRRHRHRGASRPPPSPSRCASRRWPCPRRAARSPTSRPAKRSTRHGAWPQASACWR